MGRRKLKESERFRGIVLGEIISNSRKSLGLSQSQTSIKAGVDLDSLRGIEQGRFAHPSFFSIMKVLQVLELPAEKILLLTRKRKGRK